MTFVIKLTHQATKDYKTLRKDQNRSLLVKLDSLLLSIQLNPWCNPPSYEKLGGDLHGLISRRLNKQHRLVYRVLESEQVVLIVSTWTHYE